MAMLTRRGNGITAGFISGYKREDLVQKLGRIEAAAPALLEQMCDGHCRFPMEADEYELPGICETCPVTRVLEMIE